MNNKASLKTLYRFFLRAYVENNYISKYKNALILGENFLGSYYVVIFENFEVLKVKRFLLIENISQPILLELKPTPNTDGYITMSKKHLNKNLPKKIIKSFASRGYASTIEIGLKTNKSFCWHRLVACLYYNCLGKEIHHIMPEDKTCNDITNLVPLKKHFHNNLHKLDLAFATSLARNEQTILRKKSFKENITVANNDELLWEILKLKNTGMKPKSIILIFHKLIKKSKIYEILSFYHYSKEFVIWLKIQQKQCFTELYGNLSEAWNKIIEFEACQNCCLNLKIEDYFIFPKY